MGATGTFVLKCSMPLLLAMASRLAVAAPEEVHFRSLDGVVLGAWIFQPAVQPPTGTVIALHGCGGLYGRRAARPGRLSARHQAMADLLVAQGHAVVFPDSLTPRGETQLCTQKIGGRAIGQTERRADVLGTLAWVASQPWARPERIALLGWSHGGSAVLAATDAGRAEVATAIKPAVAIAFYPGCSAALRSGWRPNAPLVLMLGEKDDWTPPGPCIELGRSARAEVNVYPDSYHGFDSPGRGQVQLRRDVPNGVNPGQGVHVGPNPAAREKANARVLEVLQNAFSRE